MMNFVDYLLEGSGDPTSPFLLESDVTITYRELSNAVNSLASILSNHYGSQKQILLISDNNYFFIVSYLSIIKSGNVAVLVETRIGQGDLDQIMHACSFVACFVQDKFREFVSGSPIDTYTEKDIASLSTEPKDFHHAVDPDDPAVIIFTSGSTGAKKGVILTHKNLTANTESIVEYLHLTQADRICVVLPFFYCYGASLLHTHIRVGGSIVLNNKIFLGSAINDINRFSCTGFAGVPSTFQILINKTRFLEEEMPSLRYMTQAGGQLPNKFIERILNAFPDKDFIVMYGATEATARLSYLPPRLAKEKLGSIGRGIPGVTLEVVDSEGRPIQPGGVGEITATGDNIMKGYFNDPLETKNALRDGRYYTGDLATIDEEGFIYVVGRSKNIIKSGGYRISPNEIEDLILSLDDVVGCVVVGVPDDLMGEAVVAVVQSASTDNDDLSAKIIAFCNRHLPSYKTPKGIEFIDEYPLNSSNKVDRSRLKISIMERRGLQE